MKLNIKDLWKTNKVFKTASIAAAAALLVTASFLIYQDVKNH